MTPGGEDVLLEAGEHGVDRRRGVVDQAEKPAFCRSRKETLDKMTWRQEANVKRQFNSPNLYRTIINKSNGFLSGKSDVMAMVKYLRYLCEVKDFGH
jgi:hypothetical protein